MPNATCSSRILNVTSCNQTIATSSNSIQFLSTPCAIETITSISPAEGSSGTLLIITGLYDYLDRTIHRLHLISGTNFEGNICEYDVQIGSSYHCPIINMTANQLTCLITNGSMLDTSTYQSVRVVHDRQGYLRNEGEFKFKLKPSIFNIYPTKGMHLT